MSDLSDEDIEDVLEFGLGSADEEERGAMEHAMAEEILRRRATRPETIMQLRQRLQSEPGADLSEEELQRYASGGNWSEVRESMAREILRRRAADLTKDDREALLEIRHCVRHHCHSVDTIEESRLAVLDRLIGDKP